MLDFTEYDDFAGDCGAVGAADGWLPEGRIPEELEAMPVRPPDPPAAEPEQIRWLDAPVLRDMSPEELRAAGEHFLKEWTHVPLERRRVAFAAVDKWLDSLLD